MEGERPTKSPGERHALIWVRFTMHRKLLASLFGAALMTAATASHAAVIRFELTIDGSVSDGFNVPQITLQNLSGAHSITNLMISIGDTAYNWDGVTDLTSPPGGNSTLNSPDTSTGGGVRSDVLNIGFTGFGPSESISFRADIDIDSSDSGEDFRTVLFNNAGADNSNIKVTFTGGDMLNVTMPDEQFFTEFTFSARDNVPFTTPAPETFVLILGGLFAVGWLRRNT